MCLTSVMFADILRQAAICHIFKKNMYNYFVHILSPYISGFRNTHSCETVLIRMVEHMKKSLDHGTIVCAVFMDLS